MGALPQAQEIVFKVQKKLSNEKIAKRKISFPTHKDAFFSFGPLQLSKLLTFSFLIILNDLKSYRSVTFSSTNHF